MVSALLQWLGVSGFSVSAPWYSSSCRAGFFSNPDGFCHANRKGRTNPCHQIRCRSWQRSGQSLSGRTTHARNLLAFEVGTGLRFQAGSCHHMGIRCPNKKRPEVAIANHMGCGWGWPDCFSGLQKQGLGCCSKAPGRRKRALLRSGMEKITRKQAARRVRSQGSCSQNGHWRPAL